MTSRCNATRVFCQPEQDEDIIDWFSGATIEQSAAKDQPRRYIYTSEMKYKRSPVEQVSKFVQGRFTDGSVSDTTGRCGRGSRKKEKKKKKRQNTSAEWMSEPQGVWVKSP